MPYIVLGSSNKGKGKGYKDYCEIIERINARLDKSRTIAHNALISNVNIVDRLCKINETEPIYGGEDDRVAIAEFARQVVNEFFEERRL